MIPRFYTGQGCTAALEQHSNAYSVKTHNTQGPLKDSAWTTSQGLAPNKESWNTQDTSVRFLFVQRSAAQLQALWAAVSFWILHFCSSPRFIKPCLSGFLTTLLLYPSAVTPPAQRRMGSPLHPPALRRMGSPLQPRPAEDGLPSTPPGPALHHLIPLLILPARFR